MIDIDDYIKNNLDNIIDDYVDRDLHNITKSLKKNNIVEDDSVSDDDNDDDDDEEGFYSKEEIYGCISDDDDSVECEEYKKLHIYLKNENNIISEMNTDYVEEEENFKILVDQEYENLHLKNNKEDNTNTEDDKNNNEYDDCINFLLNREKDNLEQIKNLGEEKNNLEKKKKYTKKNKIKIVKFSDGINKLIVPSSNNKNIDEDNKNIDSGPYILNIINLFMKYFNNKYRQNLNFFSGIKDVDSDTNKQMELFTMALGEYEYVKEKICLNNESEFYFEDMDLVEKYLNNDDVEDFYVLEIDTIKKKTIYSPSLLDCLNYLHINDINENNWNIYNLK